MIPDPDQYDPEDIQFGFHVETDPDSLGDPFDDAEVWLAAQDVPDHVC